MLIVLAANCKISRSSIWCWDHEKRNKEREDWIGIFLAL